MVIKKRKVEFYWLNIAFNQIVHSCTSIRSLSRNREDEENAYISLPLEDRLLSVKLDDIGATQICGAICNTRTSNFPYVDMGTEEIPLELDDDARGLIEKTYFLIVPYIREGCAGILLLLEKNYHAPGIHAFVKYMQIKGEVQQFGVSLYRLCRDDIFVEANMADRCSLIDFETVTMSEDFVRQIPHNGLRNVLSSCCLPDVQKHRVILSMGRLRRSIDMGLFRSFVEFFNNHTDCFSKASARVGLVGVPSTKLIDFISKAYIREVNVPTVDGNDRYLDSHAMYQRLLSLYNDELQIIRQLHAVQMHIGDE